MIRLQHFDRLKRSDSSVKLAGDLHINDPCLPKFKWTPSSSSSSTLFCTRASPPPPSRFEQEHHHEPPPPPKKNGLKLFKSSIGPMFVPTERLLLTYSQQILASKP